MTNHTHHVFFSYARADNGEDNNHFITRFHELLCKKHEAVAGRHFSTTAQVARCAVISAVSANIGKEKERALSLECSLDTGTAIRSAESGIEVLR